MAAIVDGGDKSARRQEMMEAAERIPGRDAHCKENYRLSERDPPRILECGPGPERITPVDPVVQQQAFEE
ncbi:MAG: hypothetical protein WBW74_22480 [Xanthobacteraceae bacterium]